MTLLQSKSILSECCFEIHSILKPIIPNIKRSHIYELVSAQLGYHAYKHLCEDAILLAGNGYSYFIENQNKNKTLLNTRIQSLALKINNQKFNFDEIHKIIYDCLKKHQIYAPKLDLFKTTLLKSLKFYGNFNELDTNPIYQDFYRYTQSSNNLKTFIIHLLLLHKLKPQSFEVSEYLLKKVQNNEDISNSHFAGDIWAYFENQKYEKRIDEIMQILQNNFDKHEIMFYLMVFNALPQATINIYLNKIMPEKFNLREKITHFIEKGNNFKAYTWYFFALECGMKDILSGKKERAYTRVSNYENGDFYEDGEWHSIYYENGYDEIILPKLDDTLLEKAKNLAFKYYQNHLDSHQTYCIQLKNITELCKVIGVENKGFWNLEGNDIFWYGNDDYESDECQQWHDNEDYWYNEKYYDDEFDENDELTTE